MQNFCRFFGLLALVCSGSVALAQGVDVDAELQAGDDAYVSNDIVGAMGHYEKAAGAGSPLGQAKLAGIYDWSEQNEEAVALYRASAEQGHPAGQFGLGEMYAKGEGVERDLDAAVEWFMIAAVGGHAQAHRVLANAYETGDLGRDVDTAEALRWLKLAANNGDANAMERLVKVFRDGELGVKPDVEQSSAWQKKLDALSAQQ